MGYTTEFSGHVDVAPPLSRDEIVFLTKFAGTRRMNRNKGPYYVDGVGTFGQADDRDIINCNEPPAGQPGLWCQWVPSEDGARIEWDGGEKFYKAAEWMKYLVENFLKPGAIAKPALPFLRDHVCNGEIDAQGEALEDRWRLIVENNAVKVAKAEVATIYGAAEPI